VVERRSINAMRQWRQSTRLDDLEVFNHQSLWDVPTMQNICSAILGWLVLSQLLKYVE
jgi:hypothetical protein